MRQADVAARTLDRDLELADAGMVVFEGSPQTGRYHVTDAGENVIAGHRAEG